jgi:proline dehydrogenase
MDIQAISRNAQSYFEDMTNSMIRLPQKGNPLILTLISRQKLAQQITPFTRRKLIFNVSGCLAAASRMELSNSSLLPTATSALRQSGHAAEGDMMIINSAETGDILGSFVFDSSIPPATAGPQRLVSAWWNHRYGRI